MFPNVQNQVATIEVIVEDGKAYELRTIPTNRVGEVAQERKLVNKAFYQKQIDTLTARISVLEARKDICPE